MCGSHLNWTKCWLVSWLLLWNIRSASILIILSDHLSSNAVSSLEMADVLVGVDFVILSL